MWQYYKVAMVKETSVKVIEPNGWKMMEHSYYGNLSMRRIEHLLVSDSYRIMRIWDYSEVAPFVWDLKWDDREYIFEYEKDENDIEWLLEHQEWKYYYLVNLSRREFINMVKQENNENLKDQFWRVVHPLPLLCRTQTEEAGWDYHSEINADKIWLWAWDKIVVYVSKEPLEEHFKDKKDWYADMTDILYFKE